MEVVRFLITRSALKVFLGDYKVPIMTSELLLEVVRFPMVVNVCGETRRFST